MFSPQGVPQKMALSLADIADDPASVTSFLNTTSGADLVLRPLERDGSSRLADYLGSLSESTRRYAGHEGYDFAFAFELCAAITRYDKLRFVIECEGQLIALLEYSFDVVASDEARFAGYGLKLKTATTCRYGLCVTDAFQGQGIASLVFPDLTAVARRFGQEQMILWGGVHIDNERAIRQYRKVGFRLLGPCGTRMERRNSTESLICDVRWDSERASQLESEAQCAAD